MKSHPLHHCSPQLTTWLAAAISAFGLIGSACKPTPTEELGKAQFDAYCVSCHPVAGSAVAATGPEPSPLDLTRLSQKYGSPLPRERLAKFIDGREEVPEHGTRAMPVWGVRLYEDFPPAEGTEAVRRGTVAIILDYLESIQID